MGGASEPRSPTAPQSAVPPFISPRPSPAGRPQPIPALLSLRPPPAPAGAVRLHPARMRALAGHLSQVTMSPHEPPPPPPPGAFDDFQFFNPTSPAPFFPSPPPLPSSAELFSPSETTDLFGFLENFNFDLDFDAGQLPPVFSSPSFDNPREQQAFPPHHFDNAPPSDSHGLGLIPPLPPPPSGPPHIDPSLNERPPHLQQPLHPTVHAPQPSLPKSEQSVSPADSQRTSSSASPASSRPKALLSTPQKRLNHILSEQKRRNAIRDGYLQLTTLLAPAGAPPGTGMPTRGRPKGSGSRGRGSKGKSGILFKAREYIHFLEEGRDALLAEVLKVEAAAGIQGRHS